MDSNSTTLGETSTLSLDEVLVMIFRSAIDPWLYWLIAVSSIVVLIAVFPLLLSGHLLKIVSAVVLMLVALGLPVWLLLTTFYEVESELLRIRSGPFRWAIALDRIEDVYPSRSKRSGPALSLDRLEIRYRPNKRVLVSPQHKQEFLQAIGVDHVSH